MKFRGYSRVNLLWPNDIVWRHKSGSILVQAMACRLSAPNHYPNYHWLAEVSCGIHRTISQVVLMNLIRDICTNIRFLKLLSHLSGVSELTFPVLVQGSALLIPDCTAPSHYLNQCWSIVIWTPGNKFQWNLNRNFRIFIQENSTKNAVSQNGGHFVQGEMS